jgi:hypothetical protein
VSRLVLVPGNCFCEFIKWYWLVSKLALIFDSGGKREKVQLSDKSTFL